MVAGWILSGIPASALLLGAVNAFIGSPQVVEGTGHLGYPVHLLPVIGTLELVCALLSLIPRTAVLGAILLTGYFGGAVASHVRIGEALWGGAVAMGVMVWLGIWLREPRLKSVLPLRR
jgi:hypothetical protein